MTDKVQKIREEVERLKSQLLRGACSSQVAMDTRCKEEAYNEVLGILDSMQEEPKSKFEQSIQEGDNIVYNEDLDCRVNLSQLDRVAKKVRPVSIWHNASAEPDNKKNIVIWAKDFSNLIAVEEYRPEQKKFYYESGDHYYNVNITRKGLIWAYVDDLINLTKKEGPVSEDLEQTIDTYLATYWGDEKEKKDWPFLKKMAIHFANWQRQREREAVKMAKKD